MSPATTGRVTASVTSVCPPVTAIASARHARWMSRKIAVTSAGRVPGGSSTVGWNQQGAAPIVATSLAFTCTTYRPMSAAVKVTGTLFRTRR